MLKFIPSLLLISAFICLTHAYSLQSVNSFILSYNVSNSTLAALTPINMSYGSGSYVTYYNGTKPDFVVNVTTSSYSFVLNASEIANIIANRTITLAIKQGNFALLYSLMQQYQQSSAPAINNCQQEGGFISSYGNTPTGLTCTLQNYCQSCESVPVCNMAELQEGGVVSPLVFGYIALEAQIKNYTSNLTIFYNAINTINANNISAGIGRINYAYANISRITNRMPENYLFGIPSQAELNKYNITNQELNNCYLYANATKAPWYCEPIDFCGTAVGSSLEATLTFNATLLNVIQSQISQLNSLPLTHQQVLRVAQNTSSYENIYVYPLLSKQKLVQLNAILSTTLATYNSLVAASQALLSHVGSAGLSSNLSIMESSYAQLKANYLSMNLSKENQTLKSQFSSFENSYNNLNATYSTLVNSAYNNTVLLLKEQVSSSNSNQNVANLAFKELNLNAKVESTIVNSSSLQAQLSSVSSNASNLKYLTSQTSLSGLSRQTDGPFAIGLGALLALPYATNVLLSPVYAALLSLIIGIIIFALIYLMYARLRSKKRVLVNSRTSHNWRVLFSLVVLAIIIYVILTFAFAEQASASAPSGALSSAVSTSKYVAIAINGTQDNATIYCANLVAQQATAIHKTPLRFSISGNDCTVGNATKSVSSCMNSYAQQGIPVIILTKTNSTSISLYSFYGTVLRANGDDNFMRSCYVSSFLS